MGSGLQCRGPFLLLGLVMLAVVAAQQVPALEMAALSALHSSTRGNEWEWRIEQAAGEIWNFTMDEGGHFVHNPCSGSSTAVNQTWQGLTCSQTPLVCSSQTCHITEIDLAYYGLLGSLPPDIGNFPFLEFISLEGNQVTGPIPREMGNLSALAHLSMFINELTGSIPAEIGQLLALSYLDFDLNPLTGTLPSELGNLSSLVSLYLGQASFIGTIPSELGQLSALKIFYLYNNYLTGTFPVEVAKLITLEILNVASNQLTGVIPGEIWQLTALELLSFHSNQLTGTLSNEIGQLTVLEVLYIHNNQLTGTIPGEVGQLTALMQFYIYNNQLTGTTPSELGEILSLETLSLRSNHLTGTIPSEVGKLTALELLHLHSNQLTGTIPSSIGNLENANEMWLQDNILIGTLPDEIAGMKKLFSLFLQNNILTGNLGKAFNHTTQLELTNIDISDNRLTGSLSAEMLQLPLLKVLSLSVNCFEEELPESLCLAEQVEVLSLNGLKAAKGCRDSVVMPLSGVGLFNTVGGTVPSCVWNLRNLSVLHLTGNGLTGELIRTLPAGSQVVDLSMSHNKLSGTIPLDILNIATLDLSYNRLGGEYGDRSQYLPDTNINLEINRLSGQLPVSGLELVSNGSLSILQGNIFSCSSIPENDEYSSDYVCGSRNLNDSLFVFVSASGAVVLVVLLACWARISNENQYHDHYVAAFFSRVKWLWTFLTYIKNYDIQALNNTYSPVVHKIMMLSATFTDVMQYAVQLLALILVGSFVLYLIKALDSSDSYATHSHRYAWFWTMAYMRGVVPAGFLLILWAGAISACFYRIVVCPMKSSAGEHISPSREAVQECRPVATEVINFRNQVVPIVAAFVFNVCITITVNTLYIYSTQQALHASIHFCIQLSLSIFRLLYVAIVFPILSGPISNIIDNVRFRFILLTINNLLLPCMVTVLTSDACFQGLLIPADAVSTPYSYYSCILRTTYASGETRCSAYGAIEVESSSLVPPFTYNNQCGSEVLASYIPVFLLGYSIQLILPFIALATLTYISYDSMTPSVRKMFHGIIWPEYWLQGNSMLVHNKVIVNSSPTVMLKIHTIFCNDVFNNWLLLLTFGLCSPVLAVAIVCSVLLKMSLWVVLIGRFTRRCILYDDGDGDRSSSGTVKTTTNQAIAVIALTPLSPTNSSRCSIAHENREDLVYFSLSALAKVYIPLFEVLVGSFWRIVWCSGIFVALLGWDMAMDEVGWLQSVWVPLVSLSYVLVLRCIAYFYYNSTRDTAHDAKASLHSESAVVSQSPFHLDSL